MPPIFPIWLESHGKYVLPRPLTQSHGASFVDFKMSQIRGQYCFSPHVLKRRWKPTWMGISPLFNLDLIRLRVQASTQKTQRLELCSEKRGKWQFWIIWMSWILITHVQLVYHLASAVIPHSLHFLRSSFSIQFRMSGLSWLPRSVTWNASSRMMVGFEWASERQYQRRRS